MSLYSHLMNMKKQCALFAGKKKISSAYSEVRIFPEQLVVCALCQMNTSLEVTGLEICLDGL